MCFQILKQLPSWRNFNRKFSTVSVLFPASETESESVTKFGSICRKFAEDELIPISSKLDQECRFPIDQIKKLGSHGILGLLVSPDYGGAGLDTRALSVVVGELSRGCAGTSTIVNFHNSLYADVINRFGTDEQKTKYLPTFVNGTNIGSFAFSESTDGRDAGEILTKAYPTNSGWILNGSKKRVYNVREAKAVIVFASTDQKKLRDGISAFIVDIPTEGLSIGKNEEKLGLRAVSTCDIFLENVCLNEDNLLGKEGEGFNIALSALDCARIGIASQAVGIAQASLNCAVKYARERKAFGNPLIKFQAVKHRIARMSTQLEMTKLATQQACFFRDMFPPATKLACIAKLTASETATFVSHNCIQILGGMGYTTDMPAERYYRDAKVTEIYGGVNDVLLSTIADHVIERHKSNIE